MTNVLLYEVELDLKSDAAGHSSIWYRRLALGDGCWTVLSAQHRRKPSSLDCGDDPNQHVRIQHLRIQHVRIQLEAPDFQHHWINNRDATSRLPTQCRTSLQEAVHQCDDDSVRLPPRRDFHRVSRKELRFRKDGTQRLTPVRSGVCAS